MQRSSPGWPTRRPRPFGSESRERPFPVLVTDAKTTAYTARYGELVRVDPTGGAVTITLPTARGCAGQMIGVKEVGGSANNITLDGAGSETIDGAATLVMSAARRYVLLTSDNTNWIVT